MAKQILIGTMAVIVIAVGFLWLVEAHSVPEFNVRAIPKDAPTLNGADIEKILGLEHFRIVRRAREVPIAVQESFSNFIGLPFDLADPGEEISTDNLLPGKSSRRLVFLGLSDDSAVLVYEQGGFSNTCIAAVFWYEEGGRGWAAAVDCRAKDISSLRDVVQKREISIWKGEW
jgi:hypothetical protein